MAATVTYVVIPFAAAQDGRLLPSPPHCFEDRDNALIVAGRASVYAAGVVVLAEEADPTTDFVAEPRLVAHFGQLPDDLIETLEPEAEHWSPPFGPGSAAVPLNQSGS